jgi:hypothetical protein
VLLLALLGLAGALILYGTLYFPVDVLPANNPSY